MPTTYAYDLWDGKMVIGRIRLAEPLVGLYMVFPVMSELKCPYGKRIETIQVPVGRRIIFNNGEDYTMRTHLDVSRKSKRQRAILLKWNQ